LDDHRAGEAGRRKEVDLSMSSSSCSSSDKDVFDCAGEGCEYIVEGSENTPMASGVSTSPLCNYVIM